MHLAPGVILASIPAIFLILFLYKKDLTGSIPSYQEVLATTSQYKITDWVLFARSSYVTLIVVVGFLLHPVHHFDPAWFAIMGASLLCIITCPTDVEEVMHVSPRVAWLVVGCCCVISGAYA